MDLLREIVVRWDLADPKHVPLLKEAGITVVLAAEPQPPFAAACEQAGIRTLPASHVPGLKLDQFAKAPAGSTPALTEGSWPGVSRGPDPMDDGEIASASSAPWVDANGFRIAYLRAMYPGRPALLGYLPDAAAGLPPDRGVPDDSLELALIEARAAGGNYILALRPKFRDALVRGEERQRLAWQALGRTARWLREHAGTFARPPVPSITTLVEEGDKTFEIANLMFRQNASPALVRADNPPPPDPQRRRVIVAVNLNPPPPALRDRILSHAGAGSIVVVDGGEKPWWKAAQLQPLREEEDRWFFRLGAGTVVAYKEPVEDPSEFAFDVIDLLTHKRRAVRMWQAPSVIPTVVDGPRTMIAINYGWRIDFEIQARVQGIYSRAQLLRPEAGTVPLKTVRRGETTEIYLPELRRLGVVEFG